MPIPEVPERLHVGVKRGPVGGRGDEAAATTSAATAAEGAAEVKVAIGFRSSSMLTTQAPVPVHAPLQPVKLDPPLGVAVRVTVVPAA